MSLKKLVDLDLLEEFLTKVKELIKPYSTAYGECSTVADSATKYVSIAEFALVTGVTINVKFAEANTANNPALNVNNTGAKPIYLTRYTSSSAKAPVGDNSWEAGSVVSLTYTGSYWLLNDPTSLPDYLRAGNNSTTSNNATINGQTYLKHIQGDHIRSCVRLYPGDNMKITSDANGNVTFNSPGQILVFELASFSSLPQTLSDSLITANHELIRAELGTPSAQIGDWTVTTADGSVTVSGTISGSTTLKLILGIPANAT